MSELLYVLVLSVCLGAGTDSTCEDFVLDHNLTAADCMQRQAEFRALVTSEEVADRIQCIEENQE